MKDLFSRPVAWLKFVTFLYGPVAVGVALVFLILVAVLTCQAL